MEADLVRRRREYIVRKRTRREVLEDLGMLLSADLPKSIFPKNIQITDELLFQFEHYFYDFCALPAQIEDYFEWDSLSHYEKMRLANDKFEICYYLYSTHCYNTISHNKK